MSRLSARIVLVLALLLLLRGVDSERKTWTAFGKDCDFLGYYTAATLAARHQSPLIYEEAAAGTDPTLERASPHGAFARTASDFDIHNVILFSYPPSFADLVIPFTALPPHAALMVWEALSALTLLAACAMLAWLLGMRSTAQIALIAVSVLAFRPTLNCFYYGQTEILLLFLLMTGLVLYARGHSGWAGLPFVLAIAIKLTPVILVVPLLLWRDWKVLRSILLWGVALIAALVPINGLDTWLLYFRHVIPVMSHRYIDLRDLNLFTTVEVFRYGTDQHSLHMSLINAGRLLSAAILACAAWLSLPRRAEPLPMQHRIRIVMVFLLLSCCLSPVSWRHAYVLAAPALALLLLRIWQRSLSLAEAALMIWFLLNLSSEKLLSLAWSTHLTLFYDLAAMTGVLGIVLALLELNRLRRERLVTSPLVR